MLSYESLFIQIRIQIQWERNERKQINHRGIIVTLRCMGPLCLTLFFFKNQSTIQIHVDRVYTLHKIYEVWPSFSFFDHFKTLQKHQTQIPIQIRTQNVSKDLTKRIHSFFS